MSVDLKLNYNKWEWMRIKIILNWKCVCEIIGRTAAIIFFYIKQFKQIKIYAHTVYVCLHI